MGQGGEMEGFGVIRGFRQHLLADHFGQGNLACPQIATGQAQGLHDVLFAAGIGHGGSCTETP
jgi:hypothetical protein